MHPTVRRLTARLPPFSPTGITGVLTHPLPRPALIGIYTQTLDRLSQLPDHSVYRQSTENLTRHRLNLVQSVKPPGWEDYQKLIAAAKERQGLKDGEEFELSRVMEQIDLITDDITGDEEMREAVAGVVRKWSLPASLKSTTKPILPNQTEDQATATSGDDSSVGIPATPPPAGFTTHDTDSAKARGEILPIEPALTAEQVEELESQIGDGLIEEVIEQGLAEMQLVSDMAESRVWEQLEVVPEEGQWEGFERKP